MSSGSKVVPNEGLVELLTNALIFPTYSTGAYYLVDLYQNNETPDQNSTAADFTPCDFEGYAQVLIASEQMGIPVIGLNGAVSSYVNNPCQWENNGVEQAVYGYIVTSAVTGNLLWADWFGFQTILQFKQVISVPITLGWAG